ncbi:MAG: hypothetical protein OES18_17570 [Deltaproteobacteria bacterium]|jgi:hypothetical protein|nr:hypothetical protein [Deltaproteobacteria bacterium]
MNAVVSTHEYNSPWELSISDGHLDKLINPTKLPYCNRVDFLCKRLGCVDRRSQDHGQADYDSQNENPYRLAIIRLAG